MLPTAPSGDDSNAETNFTSFGIVTIVGTLTLSQLVLRLQKVVQMENDGCNYNRLQFSSGKSHVSTNSSFDRWSTLRECIYAALCDFAAACAPLGPLLSSLTPK